MQLLNRLNNYIKESLEGSFTNLKVINNKVSGHIIWNEFSKITPKERELLVNTIIQSGFPTEIGLIGSIRSHTQEEYSIYSKGLNSVERID